MDRTKTSGLNGPVQSGNQILAGDTIININNTNTIDDNVSVRSFGSGNSEASSSSSSYSLSLYQPLWVRLACILLDFLTQTYDQIRIVPEIVLFERWLCESYFPGQGHNSHDDLCRSPDIQYELARLRSWKAFFDGVAILLTAVPMGLLADRIGRKKVIASSILGPILSLCWIVAVCMGGFGQGDMRVIWFSSVFLLMGNLSSANATIYAMAADSCPPSQRSRYFYYLYSTFLVCELFAPALASVTIEKHLIIPFAVGFGCLFACFPILGIMPETHHHLYRVDSVEDQPPRRPSKDAEDETSPLLCSSNSRPTSSSSRLEAGFERHRSPRSNHASGPVGSMSQRERLVKVLKNKNILLALFVLFAGALRQGTVSVLLQYAAVRFGWPTSQTAMLVSAIAASNIVLFLVILPQTVAFLTQRWHIIPQIIDYNVVSASLVVLTTGSILMGLASSMTGLILCKSTHFPKFILL